MKTYVRAFKLLLLAGLFVSTVQAQTKKSDRPDSDYQYTKKCERVSTGAQVCTKCTDKDYKNCKDFLCDDNGQCLAVPFKVAQIKAMAIDGPKAVKTLKTQALANGGSVPYFQSGEYRVYVIKVGAELNFFAFDDKLDAPSGTTTAQKPIQPVGGLKTEDCEQGDCLDTNKSCLRNIPPNASYEERNDARMQCDLKYLECVSKCKKKRARIMISSEELEPDTPANSTRN